MEFLSSLYDGASEIFGVLYEIAEPFVGLAGGLSDLLGLIA